MSCFDSGQKVHDALRNFTFRFFRRYVPPGSVLFGDASSWLALSSILPPHELTVPPLEVAALYDYNTALPRAQNSKFLVDSADSLQHFVFLVGEEASSILDDALISKITSRVLEYLQQTMEPVDERASLEHHGGLGVRVLVLTTWTNTDAAQMQHARQVSPGTRQLNVKRPNRQRGLNEPLHSQEESSDLVYPYAALKERIEQQLLDRYAKQDAVRTREESSRSTRQGVRPVRREISVQCWMLYAPFLAVYSAFPSQNMGAVMLGDRTWCHCIGFPNDIRAWSDLERIRLDSQTDELANMLLRLTRQVAAFCAALKCPCSGAFAFRNAPVAAASARLFLESLEHAESEMVDLELGDDVGLQMEALMPRNRHPASSRGGVCVLFLDRLTDVASAVRHRDGVDPTCFDWFGHLLSARGHVLGRASRRILGTTADPSLDPDWFIAPFGGISGRRALLSTTGFTEEMLRRQCDLGAFLTFILAELSLIAEQLPGIHGTVDQQPVVEAIQKPPIPAPSRPPRSKLGATRLGRIHASTSSTCSGSSTPNGPRGSKHSARPASYSQGAQSQTIEDLIQKTNALTESIWSALEPRQRLRHSGLFIYASAAVQCAETVLRANGSQESEHADTLAPTYDERRLQSLFQLAEHWSIQGTRPDEIINELLDIVSNQDLYRVVLPFLIYTCALINWSEHLSNSGKERLCQAMAEAAARAGDSWLHETATPLVSRLCELSALSSRNCATNQALMANWRSWLQQLRHDRKEKAPAGSTEKAPNLDNVAHPALVLSCLQGETTDLQFYPRHRVGTLAALGEIFGIYREHAKVSASAPEIPSLGDHALVLVCATNGLTISELRAFQDIANNQDEHHPKLVVLHSGLEFVDRDTLLSVCFGVQTEGASRGSKASDG
jgi:hypothetical protein